jgi:uncharacterized protein (DUF2062 family)
MNTKSIIIKEKLRTIITHPRTLAFGIALGLTFAIGMTMTLDLLQALVMAWADCGNKQCSDSCFLGDF